MEARTLGEEPSQETMSFKDESVLEIVNSFLAPLATSIMKRRRRAEFASSRLWSFSPPKGGRLRQQEEIPGAPGLVFEAV